MDNFWSDELANEYAYWYKHLSIPCKVPLEEFKASKIPKKDVWEDLFKQDRVLFERYSQMTTSDEISGRGSIMTIQKGDTFKGEIVESISLENDKVVIVTKGNGVTYSRTRLIPSSLPFTKEQEAYISELIKNSLKEYDKIIKG